MPARNVAKRNVAKRNVAERNVAELAKSSGNNAKRVLIADRRPHPEQRPDNNSGELDYTRLSNRNSPSAAVMPIVLPSVNRPESISFASGFCSRC